MSGLNDIINEICNMLEADADISAFCMLNYANAATVMTGELSINDIPVKQMPVMIIADNYDERERRRFLFSEKEANLVVTCGILQNDIETAEQELVSLKELVKLALKKDPQLNGKAVYSVITKSRKLRIISHPLYFMELTVYVKYNG